MPLWLDILVLWIAAVVVALLFMRGATAKPTPSPTMMLEQEWLEFVDSLPVLEGEARRC